MRRRDDSEARRQLWIYLARRHDLVEYAAGHGHFQLPLTTTQWAEFSRLERRFKNDPEFRDVLVPGVYEHHMNPYFRP